MPTAGSSFRERFSPLFFSPRYHAAGASCYERQFDDFDHSCSMYWSVPAALWLALCDLAGKSSDLVCLSNPLVAVTLHDQTNALSIVLHASGDAHRTGSAMLLCMVDSK